MADNVEAGAASGGAVFATDNIGGVNYPRSKVVWGPDGTATDADVGAAGVPIQDGGNSITVDGTVTANAGSGNFAITAAALPLPTGAATLAKQPALGTAGTASADVISVQGIASMTPLLVNASGNAVPVTDNSGSLTVDYATTGSGTATGALRVELPTNGTGVIATVTAVTAITNTVTTKETRSGTATTSQVADTASSTTILASNGSRLGASVHNDSSAVLYLKCGTTASATDYTVRMVQYAYWEAPFGYTGRIDGIWATDPNDGAARVTEFT